MNNPLLLEVLHWLQLNNYRKASFDRLIGIIPSASTYAQLVDLVDSFPDIFRSATLKGGYPGLALCDGVIAAAELEQLNKTPSEPLTVDYGCGVTVPPPADPIPSVTPLAVVDEIATVHYRNLGGALKLTDAPANNVTLCAVTLRNGFVILGKSACVDSRKFDEDLGRQLAYEDALKQIWPFLGFRLADQLRAGAVA